MAQHSGPISLRRFIAAGGTLTRPQTAVSSPATVACSAQAKTTATEPEEGEVYEGPPIPITADRLQSLFPSPAKRRRSSESVGKDDAEVTRGRKRPATTKPEHSATASQHTKCPNARRPQTAGGRDKERERFGKTGRLETKSNQLLTRYEQRRGLQVHQTAEQICRGCLDDIAYDNVIQLFEEHTLYEIARMINAHRPAKDRMLTNTLSVRLLSALRQKARELGLEPAVVVTHLNARRAEHGLCAFRSSALSNQP